MTFIEALPFAMAGAALTMATVFALAWMFTKLGEWASRRDIDPIIVVGFVLGFTLITLSIASMLSTPHP